jgi:4-diphosphocytidyl-2-C-methyl-D-erythritol kinase
MHLHRSGEGLIIQAPAKLNLFFEVLGKRDDGFHEIETLVYPINLCDTLHFQATSHDELTFACVASGGAWGPWATGIAEVPGGRENLVVRAVDRLRQRAGVSHGAAMRLIKRIPSAAGLGGGSSDAAAALLAANDAWRLGWTTAELAQLGAELGSDIPLFFAPGPAVCRGRGEKVTPLAQVPASLNFVVVRPPAGLSTAAVYGVCRVPQTPQRVEPLLDALIRGDLAAAGRRMFNRLEPAAASLSPWIALLQEELGRESCLGQQMSGSGTCYFGLCRSAIHARQVARRLQARGLGLAYAVCGGP